MRIIGNSYTLPQRYSEKITFQTNVVNKKSPLPEVAGFFLTSFYKTKSHLTPEGKIRIFLGAFCYF